MRTRLKGPAGTIEIQYQARDEAVARDVLSSSGTYLDGIEAHYGLRRPARIRLVVLTSWFWFPFQTAPWYLLPSVIMLLPVWARRARRIWPIAGGWQQSYPGGVAAIGIKPPRMIDQSDLSVGEQLFREIEDARMKTHSLLIHELTHACTNRMHLPAWLNEGLAMAAVDHLLGIESVLPQSRNLVREEVLRKERMRAGQTGRDRDALLALYAAGYWLVRWVEKRHPGLLKELLAVRHGRDQVQAIIEDALGCGSGKLWAYADAAFGFNRPHKR